MKKRKAVRESQTVMSEMMMPHHANNAGSVHGGVILKMLDTIAAVCATRHAGSLCVTASFDRVDFHEPIRVGELVIMSASVNYVGRTSMEVGVCVEAENMKTGRRRHTNSSYITMVAVNDKGKPRQVPALVPETTEEKRRFKEGEARKKAKVRTRRQSNHTC